MAITRHALRRTGAVALTVSLATAAIAVAAASDGNGPPDDRGALRDFAISGTLSGTLLPGVARPLALTLSNPSSQPIEVTRLFVAVAAQTSRPGCDGTTNLQVAQSSVSATRTLTVPRRDSITLPSGAITAPVVLMRDLPASQDACRGATFTFTYSGSAHS